MLDMIRRLRNSFRSTSGDVYCRREIVHTDLRVRRFERHEGSAHAIRLQRMREFDFSVCN